MLQVLVLVLAVVNAFFEQKSCDNLKGEEGEACLLANQRRADAIHFAKVAGTGALYLGAGVAVARRLSSVRMNGFHNSTEAEAATPRKYTMSSRPINFTLIICLGVVLALSIIALLYFRGPSS